MVLKRNKGEINVARKGGYGSRISLYKINYPDAGILLQKISEY